MRSATTIWRRELGSFFASAVFWVLAAGFLAFFGLVFTGYVTQPGVQATMRPLIELIGTILLFVTPLMSMRLLSEEQRSGTLELLMTSPVHDWQVIVGKWFAAFVALAVMLSLTLIHVGIMYRLATNGMDPGPLLTAYLGIALLGMALLAIGTLTSSMTSNQVVAAGEGIRMPWKRCQPSGSLIQRIFDSLAGSFQRMVSSLRSRPVSGSKVTVNASSLSPEGAISRAVFSSTVSQRTRGSVRKREGNHTASPHRLRLAALSILGSFSITPIGSSMRALPFRNHSLTFISG
jgi:ABC-2 type transport system permease protein